MKPSGAETLGGQSSRSSSASSLLLLEDPLRFERAVRIVDVRIDHQLALRIDGPLAHVLSRNLAFRSLRRRYVRYRDADFTR